MLDTLSQFVCFWNSQNFCKLSKFFKVCKFFDSFTIKNREKIWKLWKILKVFKNFESFKSRWRGLLLCRAFYTNLTFCLADYMLESVWRTPMFREAISQRLIEAIEAYGNATCIESDLLESYVYERSKTRQEYLETSARVIVHLRKVNLRSQIADQRKSSRFEPGSSRKRRKASNNSDK